jgi:hypothetical protein
VLIDSIAVIDYGILGSMVGATINLESGCFFAQDVVVDAIASSSFRLRTPTVLQQPCPLCSSSSRFNSDTTPY